MARVLPSHPIPGLSKSVASLARVCRKQLPEDVTVRVVLTSEAGADHPNLLLVRENRVLAVWVWDHSAEDVRRWLRGERELGLHAHDRSKVLDDAKRRVEAARVPHLVVYRQVPNAGAGMELWNDATPLLERLREVSEAEMEAIVARFCPEIRVATALTVREGPQDLTARFTGFLLDAAQEDAMKRDLFLPREQERVANEWKAQVVSGVAGSGKTLVLLYRLRMLRTLFPTRSERALVLTHNKALAADLRDRYRILNGADADRVEFSTFMRWFGHCPESGTWLEPISELRKTDLLSDCHQRHLRELPVTVEQFAREVDWLKDIGVPDRAAYRALARTGRGFSLREEQRDKVYDALEAYNAMLGARGERDWNDVPLTLWRALDRGRRPMRRRYDAVFIDETQFCAPIWFDILRSAMDPDRGLLFMAADPTQGFLRRRQSWRSLGLNVRGRVVRLERSYRTTRQILSFASMFYRRRQPEDAEAILAADLAYLPKGPMPFLLRVKSPHDEITRTVNEIEAYLDRGGAPGDLLVIHCASRGAKQCLDRLRRRVGEARAVNPREPGAPADAVRVLPLDAATGLESRVVFLLGARELYEREQALRISDEEREDRVRQNTKRLYTAITRAGRQLYITFTGTIPVDLNPAST